MKRLFLLFSLSTISINLFSQTIEIQKIDSIFEKYKTITNPGLAVGVIKNGNVVYKKNFGLANVEHSIPISDSTSFNIGSVTKTFTATCILLLEKEGKLHLNDSLSKYFPDLPQFYHQITIKQLLNHTSGIRDYLILHSLTPNGLKYERDALNDGDILYLLKRQKRLDFMPGTKFSYSNSGYWLLSKIIKKASGKPLRVYAQEHIFNPLQMNSTCFRDDKWEIFKNRASGYWVDKEGNWLYDGAHTQIVGPSGIHTTIDDLIKWNNAFYREKYFSQELIHKITTTSKLTNGAKINQGLGMELNIDENSKSFGHRGASFGFLAIQWYYPDLDLGVIILANRNDAFGMQQRANMIADILFPKKDTGKKKLGFKPMIITKKIKEKYIGNYWNSNEYLNRQVILENDTLRYISSGNRKFNLIPITENKFSVFKGSKIITFETTNTSIEQMVINSSGEELTFKKYQKANYSKHDLEDFLGSYYSEELGSTIKLFNFKSKIGWKIENKQYNDVLLELQKDNFLIGNSILISFTRNEYDKITGFYYNNTRANGLLFKKNMD